MHENEDWMFFPLLLNFTANKTETFDGFVAIPRYTPAFFWLDENASREKE